MKPTATLPLALFGALYSVCAQQTELDVHTYAGLTIEGEVGVVYAIEFATATDAGDWKCLEFFQLPASPYLWADKSAPATGKRLYRAVAMEVPTNMVFIPPGKFRMGSPTNEMDRYDWEGPQTDVIISRGFWMGRYEVTQGEYLEVMGSNPSAYNGGDYGIDLARPVESVSWYSATDYCVRLTRRERATRRIPDSSAYRLPTEAQWEYSCRAWTSTRFSYGDDPGYTNLVDNAWLRDNSTVTQPVGQKLPNPWGLFDMHGNVWERCQDWWSENLPGGIVLDPRGPAAGLDRVVRGGSVLSFSKAMQRSASRFNCAPDDTGPGVGFRVVLAPAKP